MDYGIVQQTKHNIQASKIKNPISEILVNKVINFINVQLITITMEQIPKQKQYTNEQIMNYLNKYIQYFNNKIYEQNLEIFGLKTEIEKLWNEKTRLERELEDKTIVKEKVKTVYITQAQKLILQYLIKPRTYKEIKEFMNEHEYTMGMNFHGLIKKGLIRKNENGKWERSYPDISF